MSVLQRLRRLRRDAVKATGKRLFRTLDRFLGRQSAIGDHPVFDPYQFPWVEPLEAHWREIRVELDELLKVREHMPSFHEISPDQERISKGDNWKTFILFGFGRKAERNCRLCPETVRVLEQIPKLQNAWFSILSPGYHIPPHKGVTKGLLRCHLALIVPRQREKCTIRVDGEILQWEEGKCMVFDDTYEHEVWNDTEEQRAVLFLDIERPFRPAGRVVSKAMVQAIQWTAYVKDARTNLVDWEARLEAAVQRADAFQRDADQKGDSEPVKRRSQAS